MDYVKEIMYLFMCGKCQCSDDAEANTLTEAVQQIRQAGWKIGKDKNTCPRCQKAQGIR